QLRDIFPLIKTDGIKKTTKATLGLRPPMFKCMFSVVILSEF
ncbi:hypothetical protein EZS27_042385, partial [termite gut metagenome]